MAENVYTVVLSTKKKVTLREPQIKHRTLAAQAVAGKANGDQFVFVVLLAEQLLRQLVCQVDDKPVTAKDLLNLDEWFNAREYSQLESVVRKITNPEEEDGGPFVPTIELGTTGNS
jgi:hypothetical protein